MPAINAHGGVSQILNHVQNTMRFKTPRLGHNISGGRPFTPAKSMRGIRLNQQLWFPILIGHNGTGKTQHVLRIVQNVFIIRISTAGPQDHPIFKWVQPFTNNLQQGITAIIILDTAGYIQSRRIRRHNHISAFEQDL